MNELQQKALDHCRGCRFVVIDYAMPHSGTYPYWCNIYNSKSRTPLSSMCNSKTL